MNPAGWPRVEAEGRYPERCPPGIQLIAMNGRTRTAIRCADLSMVSLHDDGLHLLFRSGAEGTFSFAEADRSAVSRLVEALARQMGRYR